MATIWTDRSRIGTGTAVAVGLALVVALAGLDAAWGPAQIVTVTVVLGPLATCLFAPPRAVAVVAVVAIAAALVSGWWNENFDQSSYVLRSLAVIAACAAAVAVAAQRTRAEQSRERFALLHRIADLGEGSSTLSETVEGLLAALVPAFADVCIVDVVQEDRIERLGVRAAGRDADEIEAWLRQRAPADGQVAVSSRRAAETERATLVARVTPAAVAEWGRAAGDAEPIARLAPRSSMAIPLRARGRTLGSLSFTVAERSRRSYDDADLAFAEVLAGRAALALDNAGLYAELQTAEAQLSASLGSLAEGVVVEAPNGRLVYANAAMARRLGRASPAELLSGTREELLRGFELFAQDRRPLDAADVLGGPRVFAGETPEPVTIRHVDRETREEGWTIVKTAPVLGRGEQPLLAVTVFEDVTDLVRAEAGQRLLVRAGQVLAATMDADRALREVARLLVPDVADWCAITLPDGRGQLRQVAVAHLDPAKVAAAEAIDAQHPTLLAGESESAKLMRDGLSRRLDEVTPEQLRRSARDDEHLARLEELGLHAGVLVPLVAGEEILGVLTLVSAESRRRFTDADVAVAEQLGRQVGVALRASRLYLERSSIAAALQTGLLPPSLPAVPGWSMAPLYRPAGAENWVGGDFYDAFAVRDGWMVVVGDVVGHGAAAAALTALARHTIRTAARLLEMPLGALTELNGELFARGPSSLCTLVCALLPEREPVGSVTVVCAGHPPPFHVHAGAARQVGRLGPMIGAFADASWKPVQVQLAPGDMLVLYTDGVIDTVGAEDRFGETRLADTLRAARTPADAVARVERSVEAFERGPQADDSAVLALGRAVDEPMARATMS